MFLGVFQDDVDTALVESAAQVEERGSTMGEDALMDRDPGTLVDTMVTGSELITQDAPDLLEPVC